MSNVVHVEWDYLTTACRIYALNSLLNALAPLIGAEEELGHAVKAGWASHAGPEQIVEWRKTGKGLQEEMEAEILKVFEAEHWKLYRKVSRATFPVSSVFESFPLS